MRGNGIPVDIRGKNLILELQNLQENRHKMSKDGNRFRYFIKLLIRGLAPPFFL